VDCLFVGAGDIATTYAADLAESDLSLGGVVDLDGDRATALAEAHGADAYTDLETALAAVEAPLVMNLTGHAAHEQVTRTALSADRHVYSQKPLALDGQAAASLVETATARGLALGCAPASPRRQAQRVAGRALADGRLGPVRMGYAHAHVGRVTEWHDRPGSFLSVGPLYDGGVYPLTLLVAWFGPVTQVRVADALDTWPDRIDQEPTAHSHVAATLTFGDGPVVRLTASLYVPHRSREFYGLELHGDDGSLFLRDVGGLTATVDSVRFGRLGREYTPMPPQTPLAGGSYLDPVERFAGAIGAGRRPRETGRRGAHVVAVCNAIERAAETGDSVAVPSRDVTASRVPEPAVRPRSAPPTDRDGERGLRLPPVGFGCSRYRGGQYVDRVGSIETALDSGYRLLDSAELYGNEYRIGSLLADPGSPDRKSLFVLGKVWRTNHRRRHMLEACAGSREELGIDAFDCYTLHWPEAWAHRGPLTRLAELPVKRQEALTFPTDESGKRATVDVSLRRAWENLEAVYDRGWARTLGLCNVSRTQLETVLTDGRIPPALVQVERHPYRPRTDLISYCHERGIRVVAHSPLSAPGLLEEPTVQAVADEMGLSPAGVVIAWNVTQGVVPIPSSTESAHVVENLAAASARLPPEARDRLDALEDPDFER
jgi:alcohol dehydrogenase (NADP+)